MSQEIKMVVILPEKVSTNKAVAGWKHWSVRVKLNKLYYETMLEFKNKFVIEDFPVKITYIFHWKKNALDTTNQTIMMKMMEDGLRHIDLLPDDSPKYVRSSETISVIDRTIDADYVTIKISSVSNTYEG